jgi:hypothetical protein
VGVSITLAGLTSRCTTPRRCAAARPDAIWAVRTRRVARNRPRSQAGGQILALDQLHDEIGHVAAVDGQLAVVVDGRDVGVRDSRHRPGLV